MENGLSLGGVSFVWALGYSLPAGASFGRIERALSFSLYQLFIYNDVFSIYARRKNEPLEVVGISRNYYGGSVDWVRELDLKTAIAG